MATKKGVKITDLLKLYKGLIESTFQDFPNMGSVDNHYALKIGSGPGKWEIGKSINDNYAQSQDEECLSFSLTDLPDYDKRPTAVQALGYSFRIKVDWMSYLKIKGYPLHEYQIIVYICQPMYHYSSEYMSCYFPIKRRCILIYNVSNVSLSLFLCPKDLSIK